MRNIQHAVAAAAAAAAAAVAAAIAMRHALRWWKRPRLALLNPVVPTSAYSLSVAKMLRELCDAIDCRVAIHEVDVASSPFDSALIEHFDGFIIPGSVASAYDKATYPWTSHLEATIRRLHARGRPMLGICYGSSALPPRAADRS